MKIRKDLLVPLIAVAVIALVVGYLIGSQTATTEPVITSSSEAEAPGQLVEEPDSASASSSSYSGSVVDVDDLPDEAIDTLLMIDSNGPFPYDQDGSTFQNREELLPDQARGYYREYTVDTPGLDHRGAKRIVGGTGGDLWWTDDHYGSFAEIVGW